MPRKYHVSLLLDLAEEDEEGALPPSEPWEGIQDTFCQVRPDGFPRPRNEACTISSCACPCGNSGSVLLKLKVSGFSSCARTQLLTEHVFHNRNRCWQQSPQQKMGIELKWCCLGETSQSDESGWAHAT